MTDPRAHSLMPPFRPAGLWLRSTDPARRPPPAYAGVPGYDDLITAVRTGRTPPPWGETYEMLGGPLGDLVKTTLLVDAVSDRLRALLEDAGVEGLSFHPIVVDGEVPMHLMAVRGVADADRDLDGVRMRDGADVGLYGEANLYVSPRIAKLIRKARLKATLRPSELPFDARPGWSRE